MTVKTTVSFTDRHHEFAKRMVQEGECPSVSGIVAQGIEELIRAREEREAVLEGLADTIRDRMRTPRSEFVEMDDDDTMFEDIRRQLAETG